MRTKGGNRSGFDEEVNKKAISRVAQHPWRRKAMAQRREHKIKAGTFPTGATVGRREAGDAMGQEHARVRYSQTARV